MRIALRGWDGELVDHGRRGGAQAHAICPARRGASLAACRGADGPCSPGSLLRARCGLTWQHEPQGGAAAADPSDLPCRGLPDRAVAARSQMPPRARAFRHQLGRSGDAGARAWRAALELYGAWAGRIRQGAADRAGRKGAPVCVRGGGQLPTAEVSSTDWSPTSTGPKSMSSIAGWMPAFLSAEIHEPRPCGEAARMCWSALRAEGSAAADRGARRLAADRLDFELVLVGDGEMRAEIDALIAQYGLQEKVRVTGWIGGAEVKMQLLSARALVLPSFAEGLPIVIMEAMALRSARDQHLCRGHSGTGCTGEARLAGACRRCRRTDDGDSILS